MLHHAVGAREHLLRRSCLRGLRTELCRLLLQRRRLLLRVGALAAAARLVERACVLVLGKAHVVHVRLGADGVEEPDLVAHGVEQFDVVRDHDEPALVLGQEVAQPANRVGVEVVRGLVEKQRGLRLARPLARGEENLRELHAAALATRQGLQLLVQDSAGQTEVVANLRRLRVRLVAAERLVPLLQAGELGNRLVALRPVGGLHDLLLLGHRALDLVEAAGGKHSRACGLLDVALFGVLRQVADLARARHRTAVGFGLPREDAHGRRLARAVSPHQPDTVARLHAQVLTGRRQERACADADFEIIGDNHGITVASTPKSTPQGQQGQQCKRSPSRREP